MTARFYIIPITRIGTKRGPKYFTWGVGPEKIQGIDCRWVMKDYGDIDEAIIAADISTADHNYVSIQPDVLSLPANIDQRLNSSAVNSAVNFLETYNIPGGWINTTQTYRYVARIVTGMFLFMQKVTFYLGHTLTLPQNWVNLTLNQVPVDIRDAMASAAAEMNYDYSWVIGSTTVREILKGMADGWGAIPILFGFISL